MRLLPPTRQGHGPQARGRRKWVALVATEEGRALPGIVLAAVSLQEGLTRRVPPVVASVPRGRTPGPAGERKPTLRCPRVPLVSCAVNDRPRRGPRPPMRQWRPSVRRWAGCVTCLERVARMTMGMARLVAQAQGNTPLSKPWHAGGGLLPSSPSRDVVERVPTGDFAGELPVASGIQRTGIRRDVAEGVTQ